MDWDVVVALRSRGIEVATPSESGLFRCSDEDQLTFAANGGYVLYTFNVGDFSELHAEWVAEQREHSGILIGVQQKFSVGEQLRRICRSRAAKSASSLRNQIVHLSNWG